MFSILLCLLRPGNIQDGHAVTSVFAGRPGSAVTSTLSCKAIRQEGDWSRLCACKPANKHLPRQPAASDGFRLRSGLVVQTTGCLSIPEEWRFGAGFIWGVFFFEIFGHDSNCLSQSSVYSIFDKIMKAWTAMYVFTGNRKVDTS